MQLWKRMQQYGLEVLTVLLVRNGPFHIGLSHNPDVASPCTDLSPNPCHNLWDHHMGHFFCHSMGLCGQAILMKERGWLQMWIKINQHSVPSYSQNRTNLSHKIALMAVEQASTQSSLHKKSFPLLNQHLLNKKKTNVVYLNTFRIKSVER